MKQKKPKPEEETKEFRIEKEELEALCARVAEGKIEPDDGPRLLRYLRLLLKLAQVLEHGRVRMRRLTRLLFGKRTEKDKTGKDTKNPGSSSPAAQARPATAGSATDGTEDQTEPGAADPAEDKESPAKGHGRNPASAYENAQEILCSVCGHAAGDPCPLCGKGSLRPMAAEIIIRVKGSAPVTANRYKLERLRCALRRTRVPERARPYNSNQYRPRRRRHTPRRTADHAPQPLRKNGAPPASRRS